MIEPDLEDAIVHALLLEARHPAPPSQSPPAPGEHAPLTHQAPAPPQLPPRLTPPGHIASALHDRARRTESPAPLAQAVAVHRRFGDLAAVDGVDLSVAAGEVVGLLGANGAGKTTLIRLLLGLLTPTGGDVLLFGLRPSRETRQRIGYLPQGLGLYDDLTVRENLAFYGGAFGVEAPASLALLSDPELDAARDTLVDDLPLGLRRRAAFAAALAHDPELLVLDEPTSGVDPLARTRLWETVRSASEQGAGVLVTTHHLDEASYCDRLAVMAGGRVVATGTAAEIIGERLTVRVEAAAWERAFAALDDAGVALTLQGRSLRAPGADLARIREILAAHDLVAGSTVVPATLEEAFVALSEEASVK